VRSFLKALAAVALGASAALAAEEPGLWRDEPEERPAPARPYVPRPARLFWQVDFWTKDGAFEEDEEAVRRFVEALPGAGYTGASGSVSTSGGLGFRFGLLKPTRSGIDLGGSVGYVLGPEQEVRIRGSGSPSGAGELQSRAETDFFRAMLEAQKELPLLGRVALRLKAGLGLASGRIRAEDRASGSFVTALGFAAADDYSRRWNGPTWEFVPSLLLKGRGVDVEVGAGLAGFPTMKEDGDFNEFRWRPIGLRFGLEFHY
jgi:opacity protein-like surface antigen